MDAMNDLIARGWDESLVKVYDQDMGKSAAKPLEKREAISKMIADIRERRIRTARAVEVDRLFRDEDRIDSNHFIKICKEADCYVMTDRMLYDFQNPRHVKYFRDEVDRAWEFYESQILIRASELRDRARSKGQYAGSTVAVGYIVDKTKGSPTYMKYVPYLHMAEKVLELFQDLYDCGGSVGFVLRQREAQPYIFPVEEPWVRERGLFTTNLESVSGTEKDAEGNSIPIGYKLSEPGLRKMARNRVYVGAWPYDGEWIEGNHTGIIPVDLFDAVNTMLDEREAQASPQNYYTNTPSVVHDLLVAGPEGAEHMYIVADQNHQTYVLTEEKGVRSIAHAVVKIADIERIFVEKFLDRLGNTKELEQYEHNLKEEQKKINERKKTLVELRNALNKQIDGLSLSLESTELTMDERNDIIRDRRKKRERRDSIQKELAAQEPLAKYRKLRDLAINMGKYWDRYPLDECQGLVRGLVKQVRLMPLSCHFMMIVIQWKWFPEDVGIIWRAEPASPSWTTEEKDILTRLYPSEAPETILDALPRRTWSACRSRAKNLGLKRNVGLIVSNHLLSKEDIQVIEHYQISPEHMPSNILFVTWL